jgi:hypothetical protein
MQQTHIEKNWQKMDVVRRLGMSTEALETGQILGGVVALRVDDSNIDLTQEWLELCVADNYHLVDDSPSEINEHSEFIEHRHDQSLFSALIKRDGANIIPAETFWGPDWIESGKDFPIWTPGNTTGITISKRSNWLRFRWLMRRFSIYLKR